MSFSERALSPLLTICHDAAGGTRSVAPTREAFDHYWAGALAHMAMDDVTRAYLRGIVALSFLPRPLRLGLGPLHEFVTAGFLPEQFRRELGLSWSDRHQRRFEQLLRVTVAIHHRLPRVAREFPLNLIWWDTRRRIRDRTRLRLIRERLKGGTRDRHLSARGRENRRDRHQGG